MTVHINLISLPSCLQSVIYPYVILQILKFRMATFFGEVTELTSRAVWWSDSEDEDEADQEKKNDTPNVSFQSFVAEIMNKKSLENLSCKRLSVSISKNLAPLASDKCILRVKIEKDQQSIKGKCVCDSLWLYFLPILTIVFIWRRHCFIVPAECYRLLACHWQ